MHNFVKEELAGWQSREVVWLITACAVITGLSIYWHDSVMGIILRNNGRGVRDVHRKGKAQCLHFWRGQRSSVCHHILSGVYVSLHQRKLFG